MDGGPGTPSRGGGRLRGRVSTPVRRGAARPEPAAWLDTEKLSLGRHTSATHAGRGGDTWRSQCVHHIELEEHTPCNASAFRSPSRRRRSRWYSLPSALAAWSLATPLPAARWARSGAGLAARGTRAVGTT